MVFIGYESAEPGSGRGGPLPDSMRRLLLLLVLLVLGSVLADAGVFLVLAGRALFEVQVELLIDGLRLRVGLDAHGDREVVAFGQRVAGDELAAVFLELELRGLAAVAGGDGDDLAAELGGFQVFGQRGDFDFAVLGDEELQMGFDGGDDFAAVRAGGCFFVFVVVLVSAAKAGTVSARAVRSFSAMDFIVVLFFGFCFLVWRR